MNPTDKKLVWMAGEIRTPPMSSATRIEAGYLLRCLQGGLHLEMPHCKPMPSIAARVYELRVPDRGTTWRIVLRLDADAIIIGAVFAKKTRATPLREIAAAQKRFARYDAIVGGDA